jgi:hypothetical protein
MGDSLPRLADGNTGALVIGRDQHRRAGERERLRWRREHVIVNSKRIFCVTYGELLEDLESRLDWYGPVAEAGDQGAERWVGTRSGDGTRSAKERLETPGRWGQAHPGLPPHPATTLGTTSRPRPASFLRA